MRLAFLIACLSAALLFAIQPKASPRLVAEGQGITITLYDDPCPASFAKVIDFKLRATWKEKGKTIEGCFNYYPDTDTVAIYFSDKSLAVVPRLLFKPMEGV